MVPGLGQTVIAIVVAALVVLLLAGLALLIARRRGRDARWLAENFGPSGSPEPTRAWDAASRAALGPTIGPMNVAALASIVVVVIGIEASVLVGHGRPVLAAVVVVLVGSLLTGLASTLAWIVLWPPSDRRAFEAFAWLGEHDLERARALMEGMAPTIANMKRYVRNTRERPEDRWLRVEILAALGKTAEAREVAERLPDDTPIARVERANHLAYTDWLAGGGGDVSALHDSVVGVEPADSDDRLRAEVVLALAEVRRLVAAADPDPAAPLRVVRERIGRRADGVLFASGRRQMAGFMKLSATGIIVLTLFDRAIAG